MGDFMSVTNDILLAIKKGGLYEFTNKIYLVVNGNINLIKADFSDKKFIIINNNKDVSKCEFPTLDFMHSDCFCDEDFHVLYLHTKGVTRSGSTNVSDWIKYLIHFNINDWKGRLKDLEINDCSGVNLRGYHENFKCNPLLWSSTRIPTHYSGNFWWSKSSHIKKLPKPLKWVPEGNFFKYRIMAEMWLCQIKDGKYYCAWESGIDHYISGYPEHMYVGDYARPGKSIY